MRVVFLTTLAFFAGILTRVSMDAVYYGPSADQNSGTDERGVPTIADKVQRFKQKLLDVGREQRTDKFSGFGISGHSYENFYATVFAPLVESGKYVKVFEIGLGCNMPHGPGMSVAAWKRSLGMVAIHVLEVDETCGRAFVSPGVVVHIGNQADQEALHSVMTTSGGNFDIIVDDGGHKMTHQKISLLTLMPFVKPGGWYIIEDLQTSFVPEFIDEKPTTVEMIHDILDDLTTAGRRVPVTAFIETIMCEREICGFKRNARPLEIKALV